MGDGERIAEEDTLALRAHAGSSRLVRGTFVGRHVILEKIGAGGMSEVYSAIDSELDRKVAIKLLKPGVAGMGRSRERVLREAQALARVSHPNVISIFDVGTFREQVYIVEEYLDGGTLGEWLRAAERPYREVVERFVQAGRGLAAAHAVGLVHRDFKPDNVLLGKDGRVRVTDFGLARAVEDASGEAPPVTSSSGLGAELTQDGTLIGTLPYMAPEQLRGQPADARSDQFGFAVALFEGLYGERRSWAGTARR